MTSNPQRRRFLRLGAVSAAALALGGGLLASINPGLRDGALSDEAVVVVRAIARSVLDGSLPTAVDTQTLAINGLLARVNDLIGALPLHAQAELSQLLAILATGAGRHALAGLTQPWAHASPMEVDAALQGMQLSRLDLKQQAYGALRDIVCGAYFASAAAWKPIGYPGPVAV
jgi:hypothetical protein